MEPPLQKTLLLLLCGINLILLQFVMLREFSMILTGIEIVLVLLSAAYFLGFSIGYSVSDLLPLGAVKGALFALFLLHLTLPFSPRWLAGYLVSQGARQYLLLTFLFVGAFLMSTAYSIFLPRWVEEQGSSEAVGRFYSFEVLGSMLGVVLLGAAMSRGNLLLLMMLYLSTLLLIIHLLHRSYVLLSVMGILIGFYGVCFARLDQGSLEYFLKSSKHFTTVHSLYRVHSPYQKVDVVENDKGARFLYLNGLLDFNSTFLEDFNYFLSELPARLQGKSKVLIVGSGSMSSVSHVAPYAVSIETVEIDQAVAIAGRDFFSNYNHLSNVPNWSLVIDDAKHYLGSHPEKKYDLVIMDVPAPTTIQEALLHSREFYALVGKHLTEQGIVSVSLSGDFEPGNLTPTTVAAGLMSAFPQSWVVTSSSARRSFAMAGWRIRFGREGIEALLKGRPQETFAVFDRAAMDRTVGDTTPFSLDQMEVVLRNNVRRLGAMYFPNNQKGL